MQAAHFHFCLRDAPLGMLKIEFRPSSAEHFAGSDACVAPVLSASAAPDHPHLAARETYVEVNGHTQPAPAPRFSRTPARLDRPPARPGEHTREALSDWGVDDVEGLIADGVVLQEGAP